MSALVRKEIRALLPAWISTLALAIVPMWIYSFGALSLRHGNLLWATEDVTLASNCFAGLAGIALALMPFGHEFTSKTFAFLISQPVSRERIWRVKSILLAIAMLISLAVFLLSASLCLRQMCGGEFTKDGWPQLKEMLQAGPVIVLLAYSGGLWTTVLFRTIPGALGITIVAPFAVLMVESWIVGKIAPRYVGFLSAWSLIAYAIAGIVFARWYFLRAQDVPYGSRIVSLPSGQTSAWRVLTTFRRSHKFVALLQKELQLQQVSFFIALFLLLTHVGSLLLREFIPHQTKSALWMVIDNAWILWLALPLFVGSMAVAEERRLGTLDDLLTQPVSRRGKFAVKLIVTFALALFFGAVMPWAVEKFFHIPRVSAVDLMHDAGLADLVKMTLWIAACAFFASAATRNSIEAICLGAVTVPLVVGLMNAFVGYYSTFLTEIAEIIVLPTVFWLAWRNFSRSQIRLPDIAITLATLVTTVVTGWGVASFSWNRGWEYFMRLEPEHGAPVLHATDRVKIASSAFGPIALLPDGRIWMATYNYHWRAVSKSSKRDEVLSAVTVTNAGFVLGIWQDFAVGPAIYAIKADGTLWQLTDVTFLNRTRFHANELNPPKQIGTDSDWASLNGGRNYILALKRDGSLWGLGANDFGQLGPGPKTATRIPRRLWPGLAWSRVLTADYQCLGFKKDGTSWEWGGLNSYETYLADVFPPFEPQPSVFEGTNWTSYFASFPVHFARRDDGTLWSFIPDKTLNVIKSPWTIFGQTITMEKGLHRLGTASDWRLLTARHPMAALMEDGTWLVHDGSCVGRQRSEGVKVSRYTDWITVSSDFDISKSEIIGIAADGTISSWMSLDWYPYDIGPSHRPTWSTNIFATR